jgi:hypothetical protein
MLVKFFGETNDVAQVTKPRIRETLAQHGLRAVRRKAAALAGFLKNSLCGCKISTLSFLAFD